MVIKKQPERPVRYTLRLAAPSDLSKIYDYVHDSCRPPTVFPREEWALGKATGEKLFWELVDPKGNVCLTAAVYTFSVDEPIGKTRSEEGVDEVTSVPIKFAEIGTVWRKEKAPVGFCLELAYSACILQSYLRAKDLVISKLVTQIVADSPAGAGKGGLTKKLSSLNQGWKEFHPREEFVVQFRETISDQKSREVKLTSFSAPITSSLISASQCLLGQDKKPKFSIVPGQRDILQALDRSTGKNVEIDLRGTDLLCIAERVLDLNDRIPLNSFIDDKNTALWEARGLMYDAMTPSRPHESKRSRNRGVFPLDCGSSHS